MTVSRSNSTLCWGQSPRLSRIASISVIILFPLMCAEPEEGGYKPVNIDIVVVFPAPLCPRRAVIWPLKMFSESSSTATLDPVDPWRQKKQETNLPVDKLSKKGNEGNKTWHMRAVRLWLNRKNSTSIQCIQFRGTILWFTTNFFYVKSCNISPIPRFIRFYPYDVWEIFAQFHDSSSFTLSYLEIIFRLSDSSYFTDYTIFSAHA